MTTQVKPRYSTRQSKRLSQVPQHTINTRRNSNLLKEGQELDGSRDSRGSGERINYSVYYSDEELDQTTNHCKNNLLRNEGFEMVKLQDIGSINQGGRGFQQQKPKKGRRGRPAKMVQMVKLQEPFVNPKQEQPLQVEQLLDSECKLQLNAPMFTPVIEVVIPDLHEDKMIPEIRQNIEVILEINQNYQNEPQKVIPLQPEIVVQDEQQNAKIEEQMSMLAKMDFQKDGASTLKGPFTVLANYRPQFQSMTRHRYQKFFEEIKGQSSIMTQRFKLQLMREREVNKFLLNDLRPQIQKRDSSRMSAMNGFFARCMEYTAERKWFVRKSYHDIVRYTLDHKKELFGIKQQKKKGKLRMCRSVFNQSIKVKIEKSSQKKLPQRKHSHHSHQHHRHGVLRKDSRDAKDGRGVQEIKNKQAKNFKDLRESKEVREFREVKLEGGSPSIASSVSQPNQENMLQRIQKQRSEKVQFLPALYEDQNGDKFDELEERERVLQNPIRGRSALITQIKVMNKHCLEKKKANMMRIEDQRREDHPMREEKRVEGKEGENKGLSKIDIRNIGTLSKMKPETVAIQPLPPVRASFRHEDMGCWNGYLRTGPKVKRLQILNRYHYNPFEATTGEDQCELWRKLMGDQFQNIDDYFKDGSTRDPLEKVMQKDSIAARVKESDFYISSRYDPVELRVKKEDELNEEQKELQKARVRPQIQRFLVQKRRYFIPEKHDETVEITLQNASQEVQQDDSFVMKNERTTVEGGVTPSWVRINNDQSSANSSQLSNIREESRRQEIQDEQIQQEDKQKRELGIRHQISETPRFPSAKGSKPDPKSNSQSDL